MKPGTKGWRLGLISLLTILCLAFTLYQPPVAQDAAYHRFADSRAMLGISHFLNVVSNLAFVLVGAKGLAFLISDNVARAGSPFSNRRERWLYIAFFFWVTLIGIGSAWYHLEPANATLLWDRLPMAAAFMTFLAIIVAERIGVRPALRIAVPLTLLGMASVVYWRISESAGVGDLRFYAFVQFYPALVVPLIIFLFPPRYTHSRYLLYGACAYVASKAFELFDAETYSLGNLVSGHTLKHLSAALAVWWLLAMLRRRRPVEGK